MYSENSDSVSISEFLRYSLKHWVLGTIVMVVSLLVAFLYVQISPAKYEASANIIVLGDTGQQGVARDIILGNYVALMTSNRVLEKVSGQTGLDIVKIRDAMAVSRDKNNEIIVINYTSSDPDRASSVIDSAIASFQGSVSEMYAVPADGVNVLSPPVDSGKPINKSLLTPMLLGLASGLVLALVISFLRFDTDKRKVANTDNLTDAEKRQARKIARDAELIRKQKVAEQLQDIETRKAESEAKMKEAKLRMAQADLRKINIQVTKAERELEGAKKRQQTAETDAKKAKIQADTAELELQSTVNNISNREVAEMALRDSLARRRVARIESRVTSRTDAKIIRIRAQKRIKAERAAKVSIAAVEIPIENPEPLQYNNQALAEQTSNRRPTKTVATSVTTQSFIKRPLGGK